jgi:hypothetical protein
MYLNDFKELAQTYAHAIRKITSSLGISLQELIRALDNGSILSLNDPPVDLKNVICPQCKKGFQLAWDADLGNKNTLILKSFSSGKIYHVSITCPHCEYLEDLSKNR